MYLSSQYLYNVTILTFIGTETVEPPPAATGRLPGRPAATMGTARPAPAATVGTARPAPAATVGTARPAPAATAPGAEQPKRRKRDEAPEWFREFIQLQNAQQQELQQTTERLVAAAEQRNSLLERLLLSMEKP